MRQGVSESAKMRWQACMLILAWGGARRTRAVRPHRRCCLCPQVRVFSTADGSKLRELRRGSDPAVIYSLAFSRGDQPTWLAVTRQAMGMQRPQTVLWLTCWSWNRLL